MQAGIDRQVVADGEIVLRMFLGGRKRLVVEGEDALGYSSLVLYELRKIRFAA